MAQRIRCEILQRLLEPMRIAHQANVVARSAALAGRRPGDDELYAFLLRGLPVPIDDALEQLVDVDVLLRQ
jgi:hypothetical protein